MEPERYRYFHGTAGLGDAGRGEAGRGSAGHGFEFSFSWRGEAPQGEAARGKATHGMAGFKLAFVDFRGEAGPGMARFGAARLGEAVQGKDSGMSFRWSGRWLVKPEIAGSSPVIPAK